VLLAIAVAIGVGVLIALRLGAPERPRQTTVRVIDDSASPGP